MTRLNPSFDREYRIYAPRYPKSQSEGFFIIVSDATNGSIMAMKRVNWPSADKSRGPQSSKPNTRSLIKLPQSDGRRNIQVTVISDSYIGMEWNLDTIEVPSAPKVVDDASKKAA